jgi:type I restriction enzyme R subunit
VQKEDYFTQYGEVARQILVGLLEKYADEGVAVLEQAADGKKAQNLLKVAPFPQFGSPQQIAREFGGPQQYFAAVRHLSQRIYAVH